MPSGLLILALALLAGRVTADGLRDHPIAGGELTYLDGTWTAKSDAGIADCLFMLASMPASQGM